MHELNAFSSSTPANPSFDERASRFRHRVVIGLAGVFAANAVHAHHTSAAVFSRDDMEIEGVVTEYNFKNPHINILITVTDGNGVETEWMVTGPGPTPFRRWGWTPDTLEPGQHLRIFGRKSRDGGPMVLMEAADIHGGRIVDLNPADGTVVRTVSSSSTVSRPSRQAETPEAIPTLPLRLNDGRPNLEGMWLGSRDGLGRDDPPFNARAAEEQDTFDPFVNDPAFTDCADAGLVRQAATIRPLQITQQDDRVVFEYEEFAARRIIHLDERAPETDEHTPFGHHIARYEDDALIIETTQLLGGLSGPLGNVLSDQATTIETYRRVDDPQSGPAIELRMQITDPVRLTRPWLIGSIKYLTTEPYEFIEVDCRVPYFLPQHE